MITIDGMDQDPPDSKGKIMIDEMVRRVSNNDIRKIVKEEIQKEREKIANAIRTIVIDGHNALIRNLAAAIENPNKD